MLTATRGMSASEASAERCNRSCDKILTLLLRSLRSRRYVFRRDAGSTVTRATMLVCVDPRGSVPLNVVNFVTTGSLVKKVKSFQRFFVERKAKDGSDNNGVWPAGDEADYAFTSELGGGERRASLGAVKLLTDRIERLQTKGADGAEVVPGTSRCRFDISARTMNDVRVWVGRIFFVLGAAIMVCINVAASHQRGVCEEEFGACVWGRMEHKL